MDKISEVTDEQWNKINKDNRKKVEEFLRESVQLSDQTLKQYESALKIYFYYIYENCDDKHFTEIKSRDFMLYQNSLIRRGLSSSAIRLKRSAVSSFNLYIEFYYEDEYKGFRNYVSKKISTPKQVFVHDKEPLTLDEYYKLCDELEKKKYWEQLAYLKFSFSSGCRRNEAVQLLKEIVNYEPKISTVEIKDENGKKQKKTSKSYLTHDIRCKGSSKTGKVRKLQFDQDAMNAIKKWLSVRGEDDCPYIFTSQYGGKTKQVNSATFNLWSKKIFEEIVGRRVHPHLFRETRATTLVVEQGRDIKVAQRLLGHNSVETTNIYVIDKNKDNSDEAFI